jgi:signal transduction histidine kinase
MTTPCSFHHFADYSTVALAAVDAAGVLTWANGPFHAQVGRLSRGGEPGAGSALSRLGLPGDLLAELTAGMSCVRQQGEVHSFLWSGDVDNPLRWRLIPPEDERGVVIVEAAPEPVPSVPDPSRAQRWQERGRRLFLNVIDELPVFVYMQRPDYTVAYANKKTVSYYGETENRYCYEVFGGRTSPCPHCPTFRVFETGEPEEWEFTDGEGRTFHIYDYPFEDENGEPLVMELGIDVTDLKRVERELYQAHKMRAIGVLAGGIAHDLNNNLVPIIFNVEYALGRTSDAAASEPLNEALRAAYRAAELVEQVLDYSRQQSLNRQPLCIVPLAEESLDLLRATLPPNIELRGDFRAQRDCILANPSQVQQLLLNLCRNGVQAMANGGVLSVSVDSIRLDSLKNAPHSELSLGEYVVLSVADEGCGIDPANLERIFEPFYTSKKSSGGTGMGLAVVHAITVSNGGSIHVDSVRGQGSRFTVYLPIVEPLERAGAGATSEPAPSASGANRLLLVDDDRGARQAMQRVLREAGYEVGEADDGEQGLRAFAQSTWDLVIADQSMPGMSGIDLAARILDQAPGSRIIICTGHVDPTLEKQAKAVGIAGFLMKPMSPRSLVENVRRNCR